MSGRGRGSRGRGRGRGRGGALGGDDGGGGPAVGNVIPAVGVHGAAGVVPGYYVDGNGGAAVGPVPADDVGGAGLAAIATSRPVLMEITLPAVRRFLRAEHDFQARLRLRGKAPERLWELVHDRLKPAIRRHLTIYGVVAQDGEDFDAVFAPEADLSGGLGGTWDTVVRRLLTRCAGQVVPREQRPMELAKSLLTSRVKWRFEKGTFPDVLAAFATEVDGILAENGLVGAFDGSDINRRCFIDLVVSFIRPLAFQELVKELVKANDVLTLDGLYETMMSMRSVYDARTGEFREAKRARDEGSTSGMVRNKFGRREGSSRGGFGGRFRPRSSDRVQQKASDGGDAKPRSGGGCWTCGQTGHRSFECPSKGLSGGAGRGVAPRGPGGAPTQLGGSAKTSARTADGDASAVDGVLRTDWFELPFVLDTGATHSFIPAAVTRGLAGASGVVFRDLTTPMVVRTASDGVEGSGRVACTITLPVNLCLHGGSVVQVPAAEFHVAENFTSGEVLVGRDLLRRLGVDVRALVEAREDPSRTGQSQVPCVSGSLSGSAQGPDVGHIGDGSALDAGPEHNGELPRIVRAAAVANEDGEASLEEIPQVEAVEPNYAEIRQLVMAALDAASAEGLSDSAREDLEKVCTGELLDVFRVTLVADPPAKIDPVVVRFTDGVWRLRKPAVRRYSAEDSEFMSEWMRHLERCGIVYQVGDEPVCSPAYPVNKPGVDPSAPLVQRKRITVDYRALNAVTVATNYPIPRLEQVVDTIAEARWFGKLDLYQGYWQLPLDESCQRFFSIITDRAVYVPRRLIPGSRNAAGPFQAAMVGILGEEVGESCIVYIDDVLVFATSEAALIRAWERVLRRLHAHGLKVAIKKTTFYATKVPFCGRLLTRQGVVFNPEFVAAVTGMAVPATADQLQAYLASVNWVRSSVPGYAELVAPLQVILVEATRVAQSAKKSALRRIALSGIGWSDEAEAAFRRVNAAVANATALAYPDPTKTTCVFTDASELHWAGVVTQVTSSELTLPLLEQHHVPLAFVSGTFKGSQLRWPVVEKEGWAVVETCTRLSYVLQRPGGFVLFTDHRNLVHLFSLETTASTKAAVNRIERWTVILRGFDYVIRHVEGEDNVVADMLSRWAHPDEGVLAATAKCVQVRRMKSRVVDDAMTSDSAGDELVTPTDTAQDGSPVEFVHVSTSDFPCEAEIRAVQEQVLTVADKADLVKSADGLWRTAEGKVWLPVRNGLRVRVCVVAHQGPAGHRGYEVTFAWIARHFYWPTMQTDVGVFVRQCLHCLRARGGAIVPRPWLPSFAPTEPNQLIHFDFLYLREPEMKTVGGLKYVLVIMDGFSRYVQLHAAASADAPTTVTALLRWFASFGVPRMWMSDQGSHFVNAVMRKLATDLGVEHRLTTVYAAWSNGRVERMNREVVTTLRALHLERQLPLDQWPSLLPVVMSVLNNTPTGVLAGYAPVTVFTGRPPTNPVSVVFFPDKAVFATQSLTTDDLRKRVEGLAAAMHTTWDTIRSHTPRKYPQQPGAQDVDFKVGDFVMVADMARKKSDKARAVWRGPAHVTDEVNPRVFTVQDLVTGTRKDVHAAYLKYYCDASVTITRELKDAAAFSGTGFNVDAIVDHRFDESDPAEDEVLVRWEGFEEPTWEPLARIREDVPAMVRKYASGVRSESARQRLTTKPTARTLRRK